jgi:hypothetical protein
MLNDMARAHNTDKSDVCNDFCDAYETHLGYMQDMSFSIFEIGVKNGGSLAMWKDFFPKAQVTGLDIEPDCARLFPGDPRVKIYTGSQDDERLLARIHEERGPFMLIVDDGSHVWDHDDRAQEPGGQAELLGTIL